MKTDSPGLYDPRFEHDACGVGFVANMSGIKSFEIIDNALQVLENLEHRGASGAEPNTGDGAGILIQMPDTFIREVVASGFDQKLPPLGQYVVGMAFLPKGDSAFAMKSFGEIAHEEGLEVLGWREVPVDDSMLGETALVAMPNLKQVVLVGVGPNSINPKNGVSALEVKSYVTRVRAEREIEGIYFPSLSTRVLVYKGMLIASQLRKFYSDLADKRMESALGLVHSRFSTNTFPAWPLAHPYRYIAHNGEINTVAGNRNWMIAREAMLSSAHIPGDLSRLSPICSPGGSDSASFDEVLELLHMGGRSLPHAVLMMIPEAWENHESMSMKRRAFYEYHACLMEAWDGPASVTFTDGTVIGAVLDRNGLRPARYWVTGDGNVIMASEVGVLDIEPKNVVQKGRLTPGRMFLVDTNLGRIVEDDEIKSALGGEHPYDEWLSESVTRLEDLPENESLTPQRASHLVEQRLFGYTEEELRILVAPMARTGVEPIGSMGTDTPIAALSDKSRLLFDYFVQLFAQVTNPPLDAIREELVTSLQSLLGPELNLLEPSSQSCKKILLPRPVITEHELSQILNINEPGGPGGFRTSVIDGLFDPNGGGESLLGALKSLCDQVDKEIEKGANILVLSDRLASREMAPIPSLLLTGAIHHHLVKVKTRTKVGIVVESGDAREVHHIALLLGYGATAVCPYVAIGALSDLIANGTVSNITARSASKNYVKALSKGVLKVMSKMGISTVASYTGAHVFEAIGLGPDVIEIAFPGTVSRIKGVTLDIVAKEVLERHNLAYQDREEELSHRKLEIGGEYQWRREGEYHLFNPTTVFKLQHSTRAKRYDVFKEYTTLVDNQSENLATLRGLMKFKKGERPKVPIEEVEPVEEIVKRFSTGAMSYGSISAEAHETLAIAMNRLGARSNTGEGGEDSVRFSADANGDLRRSAIKQVASGRFGVTSEYLVNADDIQIKMAQGAKPGEGGQLPGHKVYPWIAKTRHSTPGVGLISPPPHHDIYSIEDLAQLIHDLKNSNDKARVHVKLVAEMGVGTVAAGVAKAHADVVLISGHDGGTGASPLSSIKHAGAPWELGLAETQQTLVSNGLRDRIVVQVDGQMKTGRDVVIAAILGAEEYGFASAPLVVSGCVMMRVCHLDTCPVGIATQNPELRKRFSGKPEFVVNFFQFIAQEIREYLSELGFRSVEEIIGRVDLLEIESEHPHWKASNLDLSPILEMPRGLHDQEPVLSCKASQDHGLDKALDKKLIDACRQTLQDGSKVEIELPIRNVNRTVGTMLGAEVTRKFGGKGLSDDTISITFTGSAGQSFGAFVPNGITMRLIGDANDYLGKGLSGGKIIVSPHPESPFKPEEQIVAGNVILYGATGGKAFLRGIVGERFAVRNSGAIAVVEGVGDHGGEYMTGGKIVILGKTGRNFGAGMSGGIAYVLDEDSTFVNRLNMEMVSIEPLDEDDLSFLRDIISEHFAQTNSTVAAKLLHSWEYSIHQFKKVMPRDYRRVLDATREALERGEPVEEAIMAVAHG